MTWVELFRSLSGVPRHPAVILENGGELTSLETWGDTLADRRTLPHPHGAAANRALGFAERQTSA